tara:strand:+ start:7750 stop:8010 length:261 start_codon:yes stop_codon:yes gene_type:complete
MKVTPQDVKQEFFKKVATAFDISIFAAKKYFNEGSVLVFDRYSIMDFYRETWPEYSNSKHETMIEEDLKEGRHLKQISSDIFIWVD